MKKKEMYIQSLRSVATSILVVMILFGYSTVTEAKGNTVPVVGVKYSIASTLLNNIKSLKGKRITIKLKSGESITGSVKAIGTHLVHIEKLDGKDFYDALIIIDDISAIETRFRMIKR